MLILFDRVNKIIEVEAPDTEVTIQFLYNAICDFQDEQVNLDLNRIASASGKDPFGGGVFVGITVALLDGWRVRFEARLTPTICKITGGNLVAFDALGNTIFPIAFSSNVMATLTSSSSATLVEQDAIQYSSYNEGVTVDATALTSGTVFPYGTPMQPVNNLTDAVAIATARGFKKLFFIGGFTFGPTVFLSGYTLIGQGMTRSLFTFVPGAVFPYCLLSQAKVTGVGLGIIGISDCHIIDYGSAISLPSSQAILIERCLIEETVIAPSSYTGVVTILDCWSGSTVSDPPELDASGANCAIAVRNYNGGIKIKNFTQPNFLKIDLNVGIVVLDASVTGGTIVVRGVGVLENHATGTAVVDSEGLVSRSLIEDSVWDAATADHTLPDTFAEKVKEIGTDSALSVAIQTKIREIYELLGLDPSKPLYVSRIKRTAGAILQSITGDANEVTVKRQP
jgi:hypothetical protein